MAAMEWQEVSFQEMKAETVEWYYLSLFELYIRIVKCS